MALRGALLVSADGRRPWTVWVPPARRSGWAMAFGVLAVALMVGAVAVGEQLARPAGPLAAWVPRAAEVAGALAARLAAARAPVPGGPIEEGAAPAAAETDAEAGADAGAAVTLEWTASESPDAPATGIRVTQEGAEPWTDVALEDRLTALLAGAPGRAAVAVRHLATGASAGVNADALMPPASVLKLGVLGEVFAARAAGVVSLDERLRLLAEDWEAGAGVLQWRIGEAIPLREAAQLMIMWSDNVAANALLRRVGFDAVNDFYASHAMAATRLYQDVRPNVTTAADTATLLTQLVTGHLADEDDSLLMLRYLAQWQAAAWIKDGLPRDIVVAHKSGQLVGIRNDAAIVFGPAGPYVVVVLADRWADERAAESMIAQVAQTVNDYLQERYPAGLFGG